MRIRLDEQLSHVQVGLIKLGSLCEQAIEASAQALEGQKNAEKQTMELDAEISQKKRHIEDECMLVLLQQQPVAKDLRIISASMKIVSDLARIGNHAADIAEIAPYIAASPLREKVDLQEIAQAAKNMVSKSVDAFIGRDTILAEQVIQSDDTVDSLFEQIKEKLISLFYEKDTDAKALLDILMAVKYFERIGDRAVHIAKWVDYLATGKRKNK